MTETLTKPKAKELTKAEAEALVEDAFKLERKVKTAILTSQEAWWGLAEALYYFNEERAWERLGYDTLEEFLAQPDVGMSRTYYFRGVQLWKEFAVVRQLPRPELDKVEPAKAREVLPAVKRGDVRPQDALDDCKELSYRDVVEKFRADRVEKHGQKPDGSTPLDAEAEPEKASCPSCGTWVDKDRIVAPVVSGTATEKPAG